MNINTHNSFSYRNLPNSTYGSDHSSGTCERSGEGGTVVDTVQINAGPETNASSIDVRIVSFNVENLFDSIDDPHKKDEETPPKSTEDMAKLARALALADGDVVTLQEVENIGILNDFLDEYLPGQYPYRALVEGNDMRGIDVAVISKYPIDSVQSHKQVRFPLPDGKKTFLRRDLLRTDINIKGMPLTVYTTHFKAQAGGQRADEVRLGEAKAVRAIIAGEMSAFPGRRYILTGDFNDTPNSAVGQIFLEKNSSVWKSSLAGLSGADAITHPPTHRAIDYVLYPASMEAEACGGGVQRLPDGEMGSDHWLIYGDFQFKTPS
ncbi:MAG: endonuclease/exonuclease/phosphatase family protein [bacterium]|nr:endonuclease/exonuclease/phosphatase family protein [bacterium]